MAAKPGRPIDLGELLINVSQDPLTSSPMDFSGWRGSSIGISIDGPTVLDGTVKVQVTNTLPGDAEEGDVDVFGTIWRDKQSAGADIVIPADGHVTIQAVDFRQLRVLSDTDETENRRFRIIGYEPAS